MLRRQLEASFTEISVYLYGGGPFPWREGNVIFLEAATRFGVEERQAAQLAAEMGLWGESNA